MLSTQARSDVVNVQTLRSNYGGASFSEFRDVDRMASSGILKWTIPPAAATSVSDAASVQLQRALRLKYLMPLRDAWRKHVVAVEAPVDFEHIGETFDGVFNLIEAGGPQELDMSGLDPRSTNGEHLVAALRAAYRWREEVRGWPEARDVARLALRRANHGDVELCLAGLE